MSFCLFPPFRRRSLAAALVFFAIAIAIAIDAQAHADLIVTVESVSAEADSIGNVLDVILTNTNASAVDIGGISFSLTTSPEITFTEANINTNLAYIFAGHSLFGPIISTTPPPNGQTLQASDQYDTAFSGISLAGNGGQVGLGRVVFNAGSPTGVYSVMLSTAPGATSLSDPNGNDLVINSLVNGTITIIPATAAIPEPGSLALVSLSFLGLVGLAYRKRQKGGEVRPA